MTPSPAGRTVLSVVGATAALGAATLAYTLIEARCPVLRRIDVPVLAPDEKPLTVLHLADLHLTDRTEARVTWVRHLARLRPDVVVNTGDNLSLACGLEPLQRALEPLTGLPGAFVMGDHDYRTTVFRLPTRYLHHDPRKASSRVRDEDIEALPWEEVRDLQAAGGWANLTNRRDSLTVGGRRIELVGVDDPHANRDVFPAPGAGGDTASSGSANSALSLPAIRNREGRALRLGLTHAPYRRSILGAGEDVAVGMRVVDADQLDAPPANDDRAAPVGQVRPASGRLQVTDLLPGQGLDILLAHATCGPARVAVQVTRG